MRSYNNQQPMNQTNIENSFGNRFYLEIRISNLWVSKEYQQTAENGLISQVIYWILERIQPNV